MKQKTIHPSSSPEQLRYAAVLDVSRLLGLGILIVTFALYISGAIKPAVPLDELPRYWSLNAHDFHAALSADHFDGAPPATGWRWVSHLGGSDFLNMIGICLLAGATIVCFVAIVPVFVRRRDWVFAILAALQAILLFLTAVGFWSGGG